MISKMQAPAAVQTSKSQAPAGVAVLQRKAFKEDPKLLGELVKLRTALGTGNAVGLKAASTPR